MEDGQHWSIRFYPVGFGLKRYLKPACGCEERKKKAK
jgi:hypothetical protein